MIDHLILKVRDLAKSKAFYQAALEPLGYKVTMEFGDNACSFGPDGRPVFWIAKGDPTTPIHIAFVAENRDLVGAFYQAAIAAGGRDNGAPGLRPQYHERYFGAFVFDLDGHNVEAVCHRPTA